MRDIPRYRIGKRWHQSTLVVHIASAGIWLGIDVLVAVLVLTGRFGSSVQVRSVAYQALATFIVWPMLVSGLVCLVTGLVLGLVTKWGLLRYWWVLLKLIINLLLCTLILFSLRPGMAEVGAYGRTLRAGAPVPDSITTLFFPPAVSLSTLAFATVLSVMKPWGRLRKRQPARAAASRSRASSSSAA